MSATALPSVTVLVPARDEVSSIDACIDAIGAQDHPLDDLEVLVIVDGGSRDGTAARAHALLAGRGFGHSAVILNDGTGTPSNLNLGLRRAGGAILCRVDARSRIPRDYVRRCIDLLTARPEVAVVGGAQVAIAPHDTAVGVGIARALNNRWGTGWSRYRRAATSGVSDTVYLGTFRTADLRRVGGWDPALGTNQDFDLNRRLSADRRLVWFETGLPVEYVPRSTLPDLYRQYVRFGRWKVRYWRHRGDRPRPRQVALLAGVPLAGAAAVAAVAAVPPGARGRLVAGAAVAAVVFEAAGSRRPRGGLAAHGCALLATSAVAAGWLGGAWRELLGGGRSD